MDRLRIEFHYWYCVNTGRWGEAELLRRRHRWLDEKVRRVL